MTIMRPDVAARLARAVSRLEELDLGDGYDPRAPASIVAAGLPSIVVPTELGGLGAGLAETVEVLAALGAVDGSAALGFAMHLHVVGAAAESSGWPGSVREALFRDVVGSGALVNAASTEEGGGSPARGAIPGTRAARNGASFRLTGEKTWTTWLPALRYALVSARIEDAAEPPNVGLFLVDLDTPRVERREGFEALGMRGSASGLLRLDEVVVPAERLVVVRPATGPDPRGPAPQAWFGLAIAATYLGVGEGARRDVARWALDRRPGDGTRAVAELPTIRVRLGRIDAQLRAARLVVQSVAERWDAADEGARPRVQRDVALAKLVATQAAVEATEEALRIAGGPGFRAGRLERAFRDARAGLINPPLEDVAYQDFAGAVLDAVSVSRPSSR